MAGAWSGIDPAAEWQRPAHPLGARLLTACGLRHPSPTQVPPAPSCLFIHCPVLGNDASPQRPADGVGRRDGTGAGQQVAPSPRVQGQCEASPVRPRLPLHLPGPGGLTPRPPPGSAASQVTARGSRCIHFLFWLQSAWAHGPPPTGRPRAHRQSPACSVAPCPSSSSGCGGRFGSVLLICVWVDTGPLPHTAGPWGGVRTLLHNLCKLPHQGAVRGTGLPFISCPCPGAGWVSPPPTAATLKLVSRADLRPDRRS